MTVNIFVFLLYKDLNVFISITTSCGSVPPSIFNGLCATCNAMKITNNHPVRCMYFTCATNACGAAANNEVDTRQFILSFTILLLFYFCKYVVIVLLTFSEHNNIDSLS